MDQQQLIAFDQIVRLGSYARAADELGIAQPTLTARIQALERDAGGRLFVRHGRGVMLSDRGAAFLPYTRRALEVLREGVEMGERAEGGAAGRVTLAALESLSGYFLGPVIARYRAEHPDVSVAVRAGNHESVVLVTAAQHPLARRSAITIAELLEGARPFLWMRWWLAAPPRLTQLMERATDTVTVPFATAREMVLAGSGAGFFPWMQVADLIADGRLKEIKVRDLPALSRASALVEVDRGAPRSAAAQALADGIRVRAEALKLLARPLPRRPR